MYNNRTYILSEELKRALDTLRGTIPPRLGLEVIGPWAKARPVAEALGATVLKARPGIMSKEDWDDALGLMRQFTPVPWAIVRSKKEIPTFEEALAEIRDEGSGPWRRRAGGWDRRGIDAGDRPHRLGRGISQKLPRSQRDKENRKA